ncbi:unnamed protein product [Thlaspi arvense]|uniref:Uncharacterized protein n=1 Tax=Thlaspi arvense TaxID=13288 RepID=A0AAU9SR16_THLAR|nr:unnamed protein product [Thlaspi arvense]CAH2071284.1 unnamed protein product [Thlaspi arvense]
MEKVTTIFVVLFLISSCMIMRSEGQFRCEKASDCDPRGCRLDTHVICNERHKCTCAHGAPLGGECDTVTDCYLSGCPPFTSVRCIGHVCGCYS